MNTAQITMGFRKEIWEFNKTLFWVPVLFAALIIIAPLAQLLLLEDYQIDRFFEGLTLVSERTDYSGFSQLVQGGMSALFVPFLSISLVIQLYYFTSCLFDERRDLSVYFWRSLPVSDAQTVITKMITGAIVIPGIFLLAASVVLIIALVLVFVATIILSTGFDISLWKLWAEADLISNFIVTWLNIFPYAIWMFPVYAWLMLSSMFANKAPFLWAVLPIAVILLVESFVVAYFNLDSRFVADTLLNYFQFTVDSMPHGFHEDGGSKLMVFTALSGKISIVATLIGVAFMYLTYWLRVNRSHG